ncbi:DUF4279 domain-containing protein [Marinimicrobium sp. C6131]|uniref:DUF4279 domain-containing protein n=1 Tax=Marinimicrobium sp. C6131 TaxID=3022676 RepID=UPI00223CECF1|nr:DUF4279 domain-containing protein [Marinimicrobium sp. C6131]UZJ45954.1 DUF4279 domain-containing protein [Marinimicrobium sp. C6131]
MLELKATLRISSKELTLGELKKVLGDPTSGFSMGETFSRGAKKREFSYWAWELDPEIKVSLESHIRKILKILDAKQEQLSTIKNKVDVDIFCRLSSDNGQGGAVFSSNLVKLIEPHGIDVIFDLYMDPEEEDT